LNTKCKQLPGDTVNCTNQAFCRNSMGRSASIGT
jgi:hypothetical protein